MAKNRVPSRPNKQQTPSMSPPHPVTVNAGAPVQGPPATLDDDDDDDEICPVCEGDCTCRRIVAPSPAIPANAPTPAPPPPQSSSFWPSFTTSYAPGPATTMAPQPAGEDAGTPVDPPKPLKIKLTLTPNLLAKTRALKSTPALVSDPTAPKRRGRPPKAVVAARIATTSALPVDEAYADRDQSGNYGARNKGASASPQKKTAVRKGKGTTGSSPAKRTAPKRKATKTTAQKGKASTAGPYAADTSSDLTEMDADEAMDDDGASIQFPTFVSAICTSSASSSSESSSSDSDDSLDASLGDFMSDFDDDPDIEAEEESLIRSEARQRARARREMMMGGGGGEDGRRRRRKGHNHPHRPTQQHWEIRPRKNSVGPDDVSMDEDSDDEDSDDSDDEEEEAVEGDAEAGMALATGEDDVDADERTPSVRYAGLATFFSEDEESTFDADLFFANLSDSSADEAAGGDAPIVTVPSAAAAGEDDNDDADTGLDAPFELTASWDGSLVFSNSALDAAFDLHHHHHFSRPPRRRRGPVDTTTTADDADMDMDDTASTSGTSGADLDADTLDSGSLSMSGSDAEEDADEPEDVFGSSDGGNTTEEELVDQHGLPTPRAMRLFRWPAMHTVSSIDPQSTMSPVVSPGAAGSSGHAHSLGTFYAPSGANGNGRASRARTRKKAAVLPADILEGRVFLSADDDDSDAEFDVPGPFNGHAFPFPPGHTGTNGHGRSGESSSSRSPVSRRRRPVRMGEFDARETHLRRRGIIKDGAAAVPSPWRRKLMRSRKGSLSGASGSESMRRLSLRSPIAGGRTDFLLSPDARMPMSPDLPAAEPIDLDDVLDISFLVSDPTLAPLAGSASGSASVPSTSTSTSATHNANRWDFIPLNAFRAAIIEDPSGGAGVGGWPGSPAYGSPVKSGGSSSMWHAHAHASAVTQGMGSPTKLGLGSGSGASSSARKRSGSKSTVDGGDALGSTLPALMPIAEHRDAADGDTTPTTARHPIHSSTSPSSKLHQLIQQQQQQQQEQQQQRQQSPQKSKHEKKLLRKQLQQQTASSASSSAPRHNHSSPKHRGALGHARAHHPNQKTRSSSAMQRKNFSGAAVPPFSP